MPLYKDEKTGKWYCKFYYKDWNGERKQKKKSGFALKRDAAQWERDFLQNHAADPSIPLAAVCEKYLELKRATWKPLTYRSNEATIRNHIVPQLGHIPINEITPLMISEWQKKELETVSRRTLALLRTALSSIFNFAVNNYGLQSNPCRKAEKIAVPRKEMNFITVEQYKYLLAVSEGLQFRTILKVLFWTGLRWGELAALTVSDIQPDYINVNKILIHVPYQGHQVQPSTKSDNGMRKVPIHEGLYQDIQAYIGTIYGISDDDLIFTLRDDGFRDKLRKACEFIGIQPIRIHDLRHSHVALLIHMGLFPNAIAKRIGDVPDTIINTYAHIYKEDETAICTKFEELDKSTKKVPYSGE